MQVIIVATSSLLDENTALIETSTTIGEMVTTVRVGYDRLELMENRFLSGTFEERVESLRKAAERMTETNVKLHFQALAKIAQPDPQVTEVKGAKADILVVDEVATEKPAKKTTTRKPRTPKAAQ